MSKAPASSASVDDKLRTLIAEFGKEAVRGRATALTTRRGRPPIGHWKWLWPELLRDAENWLSGRQRATNYAIAKRVAQRQGAEKSFRQLQDKLARQRERRMLEIAVAITSMGREDLAAAGSISTGYSFPNHFRALEALVELDDAWIEFFKQERLTLERYRQMFGEPDESTTWAEILERLRELPGGLLGTAWST